MKNKFKRYSPILEDNIKTEHKEICCGGNGSDSYSSG